MTAATMSADEPLYKLGEQVTICDIDHPFYGENGVIMSVGYKDWDTQATAHIGYTIHIDKWVRDMVTRCEQHQLRRNQ